MIALPSPAARGREYVAVDQRRYRVGHHLDDLCRSCKMLRSHTVIVADPNGTPDRVMCDYCNSQHNYRGGRAPAPRRDPIAAGHRRATVPTQEPFATVSERERIGPPISHELAGEENVDLELLLRKIMREESGLTPTTPSDKWRGGELILRPGREGIQEKSIPIETFFNKIVMVRNRLRTLEQHVNTSDLPSDVKAKLQGYITASYGSLTSFNVLFADEDDRFRGSSAKD